MCVCVCVHADMCRSRYTVNKNKMILAVNAHLNKMDVKNIRFGCLNPVMFWKIPNSCPKICCEFYELLETDAGVRP